MPNETLTSLQPVIDAFHDLGEVGRDMADIWKHFGETVRQLERDLRETLTPAQRRLYDTYRAVGVSMDEAHRAATRIARIRF